VRFVARITIALATLLGCAACAWSQSPISSYGNASSIASDSIPTRATSGPSLGTSEAVEGIWVSDRGAAASAIPVAGPSIAAQPLVQPGMMAGPGAYFDGGMAGEGCEGDCPDDISLGRGGHFRQRAPAACRFNDLWTETQSHRRIFVQADYLTWWGKGNPLPPLVTTSPPGTPPSEAGVLPESATTSILFGNGRVDQQTRNGGRINVGYWLIDGEFLGVEGQYFALAQQNSNFFAATDPDGIVARPFLNVNPILGNPTQDSALVSYPATLPGVPVLDGSISIRSTADLQSAGALFRGLIWIDFTSKRRLDWVMGYRFLRLSDSVIINDQFTATTPFSVSTLASQDVFSARNVFNGGEIGLKGYQYWGRLSMELLGKCAFGENSERVYINGSNTVTALGTTVTNVGGFLTQPSNIGTYNRDVFAVVPEADINLRFDVTCNMRLTAGYTFIYINRVQRSGDAINTTVNPTQINGGTLVGDAQPAFAYHDSGFWIHGVNAGFEYRW
jgi:hypothetical protein